MKAAYIGTLTLNAVDALVDGEVRAVTLLRMPLNFNLISSRAVEATKQYRENLERLGGSDITVVHENGMITREFKPWLSDAIQADKERVGKIVQDGIKQGKSISNITDELETVFTAREHNAALTAFQETKALYNQGTFKRFEEEHIQQGTWRHLDPQQDPREEHQDLDGQVFDLDDPIWGLLDEPNCHCWCEPVINLPGINNLSPVNNAGEEGSWITINGVHILIKEGETAGDAFKRTTGKELGGSSGTSKGSGSVKDNHKSAISAGTMDERSKEDYVDIASEQESKLSSDIIEYGKSAYNGNLEETEDMYLRDVALKDYCNEEYSVINANLRGEHFNEYKNYENIIDTAIESSPPIPEGLELYRGVGINSGQTLAGKEIGDVCQDAAYQSHSLNPATAGGFAKGWEDEEGNTHKTIIRAVTSGKEKGIYINNELHGETELIIARDTAWTIVGKEEFINKGDEYIHVVTVMKYEEE